MKMTAQPRRARGRTRTEMKEETRQALVRAGLEEFAARGLDVPSLDDICARAGYTRGAFYVHFADRDALLKAVMEHLLGRFLDTVVATADPAGDLERTIEGFATLAELLGEGTEARVIDGEPVLPFHHLLDACRRSPATRVRLRELLNDAARRLATAVGAARDAGGVDVDPEGLARLLVVLGLGVLAALDSGLPLEPRQLQRTLLALVSSAASRKR